MHGDVDGIRLDVFEVGRQYDVGTMVAALFLAEAWAEPVADDEPPLVIPFSEVDPFVSRVIRESPPNLVRDTYPPYVDDVALAADRTRRSK